LYGSILGICTARRYDVPIFFIVMMDIVSKTTRRSVDPDDLHAIYSVHNRNNIIFINTPSIWAPTETRRCSNTWYYYHNTGTAHYNKLTLCTYSLYEYVIIYYNVCTGVYINPEPATAVFITMLGEIRSDDLLRRTGISPYESLLCHGGWL